MNFLLCQNPIDISTSHTRLTSNIVREHCLKIMKSQIRWINLHSLGPRGRMASILQTCYNFTKKQKNCQRAFGGDSVFDCNFDQAKNSHTK